jgi:hypothetical protein
MGSAVVSEEGFDHLLSIRFSSSVKMLWKLRTMLKIPLFLLSIVPLLACLFSFQGCSNHTTSHFESRIWQGGNILYFNVSSSLCSCKVK